MGEKEIRTYLREAAERKSSDQALVQRSIDMARGMGALTQGRLRAEERSFLSAVSRVVADAPSRRFVEALPEQVFYDTEQPAENLRRLLSEVGGIPTFFSSMGRLRLKAASMAARSMQDSALAEVQRVFRSTFSEHVLSMQAAKLNRRAEALGKEGVRLLVNPLCPSVFGADGAEEYAAELVRLLAAQPHVGLCVQPWRLCPGLSPCSPGLGARELSEHLQNLLEAAAGRPLIVETQCSDTLPIIVEALKLALDHAEFDGADVALMLPGYLRSSASVLRELVDWARPRAERKAAPLKVLLVKGNHLDAERRCSALYGTESQLCRTKFEADTCYIRLLNAAMNSPANVITPVVGTHELLHLCYAALRWAHSGREGMPPVCCIYGLGNHLVRQFARFESPAMLCAPLVPDAPSSPLPEQHLLAMVRELARPEGFLCSGYAAESSGTAMSDKAKSLMAANSMSDEARVEPVAAPINGNLGSLLERAYVDAFYAAAKSEVERTQAPIPLCPGGQTYESPLTFIHRSLTVTGLPDYRFSSADYAAVERTLQQALALSASPLPAEDDRVAALQKAARELRRRSAEFAALLVRDSGCTLMNAQEELRDAADALRYYAADALRGGFRDGTVSQPLGVVAVVAGVARPLSEAVGGIAAAWIAGNTIIYKPAAYSTLLGTRLAELLTQAGIRLLCLPCVDNEISTALMTDSRVQALICSGGRELLHKVAEKSPGASPLITPTAGSVVYISQYCDWEAALRDIVPAAFSRSGQAPTCPHTLIVHARVYDNPAFVTALGDAVSSLCTQPTWREGADLGPMSSPLTESEKALIIEAQKEEATWPLPLRAEEAGSLLLQPGVCLEAGVGSSFARRGRRLPAIGLVRATSSEEALELQQELLGDACAILYSHDGEEIAMWKRELICRSLAINCCPSARPGLVPAHTLSSTLQGARAPMAGGPNYAASLCIWQEQGRPAMRSARRDLVCDPKSLLPNTSGAEETMRLSAAADSISYWWEKEFGVEKELPAAPGCRARLCYRPMSICLRVEEAMSDADVAIALVAALQAGCRVQVSSATQRAWLTVFAEQHTVPMYVESRAEYKERFPALAAARMILRDPAAMDDTLERAAACGLPVIKAYVLANARLEMLHCLTESLVITADS